MIERLRVRNYLCVHDATLDLGSLTVLLGRNGSGKSALLGAAERLVNFGRGGLERTFGAPPYSLADVVCRSAAPLGRLTLDARLRDEDGRRLDYAVSFERTGPEDAPRVAEETLAEVSGAPVASQADARRERLPTLLDLGLPACRGAARVLRGARFHDLDPSAIAQPVAPEHALLRRDGGGVAAFLASLRDRDPARVEALQARLVALRPGTRGLRVWSLRDDLLTWGIEDEGLGGWRIPAAHVSWGDRLLVGILCALYGAPAGGLVSVEEIDRGFHPGRYLDVVDLLTEATEVGLDGSGPLQVVATTHSPALVSRLGDRLDALRLIERSESGTNVRPMEVAVRQHLGVERPDAPLGEVWMTGLLESG